MLLATIDENFHGTYDFFYLPIDFKNKCNVGYAFINMTQVWGRVDVLDHASVCHSRPSQCIALRVALPHLGL